MKLSSKPEVVVVTGASAGLGRAIVREFAADLSAGGRSPRRRTGSARLTHSRFVGETGSVD